MQKDVAFQPAANLELPRILLPNRKNMYLWVHLAVYQKSN